MISILILLLSGSLLVSVALSCLILLYLRRDWSSEGETGTLLIAGAIFGSGMNCFAYSLELLVPDLTVKYALVIVRYGGLIIFVLSTFFYCLWFTDLWMTISSRMKLLICLPYLLSLVILVTNPLHHLYYPVISSVVIDGYQQMLHTNGLLYYPLQIYTLILLLITAILFTRWKSLTPRAYGPVVTLGFCGFLMPLFGYIVYLSGFRPFGFLNLTSYFMFFTTLFFVAAVFKYKFFEIKPIAHQMVIESLPAGVILLDTTRRVIEINHAAAGFLSLHERECLGRDIADLMPDEDPITSFCYVCPGTPLQVFRSGRNLILSLSRLQGYKDEQIGLLLLITDVSSEKKAEQEMRKTAALMRTTFDSIHDGIMVAGTDGSIMEVNDEFWKIWDFQAEMQKSSHIRSLLSRTTGQVAYPETFENEVNTLLLEDSVDTEIITLKNGKILETYSVPLFLDGTLAGRIWSFHDLTELKQRERDLRESEARYKLIMENAADLIWTLTPEGVFSYVSPSWTRIIGYAVEDTVGRKYTDFVHPEDIPACEEYLARSIQARERQPDVEYRVLHTDGSWHWHVAASVPIYDEEGNFSALIGISRDITDKKMSDQALKQANRQLNLLTSITRHDILNLIMAALAYLDFIGDIPKDTRLTGYLEKVREIVEKIQEQIEFTRLYESLGSQGPLWQDLTILISIRAIPPGITRVAHCSGISVYADPLLPKVFDNLIDNSVRHGDHVTQITISCAETPVGLAILYEDNGIGVATTEKEVIFERGYGKNTGLGLFLVREILAISGISINETGTHGTGARFVILVPKGSYRSDRSAETHTVRT